MKLEISMFRVLDFLMKTIVMLTSITFISLYEVLSSYSISVLYILGFVWSMSSLIKEDTKQEEHNE